MMTNTTRTDSSRKDRWMIHAVLYNGSDKSVSTKLTGVIAGRASLLPVDEFIVIASDFGCDHLKDELLQRQIRDHSSIVNDLHREADILPFRFGVIVTTDEILSCVRLHKQWYETCLQKISGFSELNLRWAVAEERRERRFTPSSERGHSESRGFEYLKSKLMGKQAGSEIDHELGRICTDFTSRFPSETIKWQSSVGKLKVKGQGSMEDSYIIARIELLVRREVASTILGAVSSLVLRSEKPTVASGPWPPYSFIESENVGNVSPLTQRCAITFPYEAVG